MSGLTISDALGKEPVVFTNDELTRRQRELEKILQAILTYLDRRDGATINAQSTTYGVDYEIAVFPKPSA